MNRRRVNMGPGLYGATLGMPIEAGDRGTEQTVAAMTAIVHSTDDTQVVHRLATRIAADHPRNPLRQLQRVYDFMKAGLVFKRDTACVEQLRHPDQLLAEIEAHGRTAVDCDDASMLGAALVRALGIRAVIVVMGRDANRAYEHVYFGGVVNGVLMPLDPQETAQAFTQVPAARRRLFRV